MSVPTPPFDVLAIDDHDGMLRGLWTLQSSHPHVIRTFERCLDFSDVDMSRSPPDVVILDLWLKNHTEVSTPYIKNLRDWGVSFVLLHTAEEGKLLLRRAMEAGIDGLCLKGESLDLVAQALHRLGTTGFVFSGPLARAALDDRELVTSLTDRQLMVLKGIAHGMTDGQIAHRLAIKQRTVNSHAGTILQRYGAANRAEAVRIGFHLGELSLQDQPPEPP